ncbi:MAG: lysylphosphatidylglycerol synthase transmembrane domain-containing protein [Pseudoflavonifractor sp.]
MNQKKNWLGGGLLLALMALTLFLLLRDQPFGQLAAVLGSIRPGYVAGGLGLMFLFVGCEAMCSKLILTKLGHAPKYRRCLGYSFVGFYVSSITPSATGGQPAQIYYMSRDGIPPAHGALNMMLIAVCYQVSILLYAIGALIYKPSLLAAMGGGLGLLLLYGAGIMLVLTAGMLGFLFLPHAAAKLAGHVLSMLTGLHILKNRAAAQEKLDAQMAEYRAGADCLKRNPALLPKLLGLTFLQLTALFLVPFMVYRALGLTGHAAPELVCAQALLTLAVSMLPLPGAVGASEGGFITFFTLFFGAGLVTPAVLVSRGISFYAFLAISALATLVVHLTTKKSRPPCGNEIFSV